MATAKQELAPDDLTQRTEGYVRDIFERGLRAAVADRGDSASPCARPHQVHAVTSLLLGVHGDHGAADPVNYLMQHSTGSGKSFTIAALAVALAGWADGGGGCVHTVLVVNDRLQLDKQLGACVEAFWRGNGRPEGGIRRAATTSELSTFLGRPPGTAGRPTVILTTVQKLAALWRSGRGAGRGTAGGRGAKGGDVNGSGGPGRIAIIADEAHRHHGHGTTDQIHQILASAVQPYMGFGGGDGAGAASAAAGGDARQQQQTGTGTANGSRAGGTAKSRPQQRRQPRGVTYFGFTATPSHNALQLFGVSRPVLVDPETGRLVEEGQEQEGDGEGQGGRRRAAPRAGQEPQDPLTALLAEAEKPEEGAGGGGPERAVLYSPYHSYTMRHAVQDGFVLDVLRNFTAVTPRLQIAGVRERAAAAAAGCSDGGADGGGDQGQGGGGGGGGAVDQEQQQQLEVQEDLLVEAASNSRDVVERKAAYIVERFVSGWRRARAAGFGCYRGMVVARSRQHVAWYAMALRRVLERTPEFWELAAATSQPGDDSGPAVFGAFSGSVPLTSEDWEQLQLQTTRWRTKQQQRRHKQEGQGLGADAQEANGLDVGLDSEAEDLDVRGPPAKRQRRGRGGSGTAAGGGGSGWDAALGHLDGEANGGVGDEEGAVAVADSEGESGSESESGSGSQDWEPSASESGGSDVAEGASEDDEESSGEEGSGGGIDCGRISSGSEGGKDGGDGAGALPAAAAAVTPTGVGASVSVSGLFGSDATAAAAGAAGLGRVAEAAAGGRKGAVRRAASRLTVTSRPDARGGGALAEVPADDDEAEAADGVAAEAGAGLPPPVKRRREEGSNGGGEGAGGGRLAHAPSCSSLPSVGGAVAGGGAEGGAAPGGAEGAAGAVEGRTALRRQRRSGGGRGGEEGVPMDEEEADGGEGEEEGAGAGGGCVLVTEGDVNGRHADPRAARLLVVCSKYETGYDDPRLGTMFIDRSLSGARAVQVLGRLNRPAPHLGKAPALLGVVDFVNSVGGLREAFEEFYDVTTMCTGKLARRLRQERQLERALARVLELLQPAADRAAAAAAAAATAVPTKAAATAAVGGGAGGGSGGLMRLGVGEMAALAGSRLPPEARRALESDLAAYVALCGSLGVEMPEMPAVFASALLAKLTASRQERERAAAALARAGSSAVGGDGVEGLDADGTAAGSGRLPDVHVAVCELEETFCGAIYLGGGGEGGGAAAAAVGSVGAGGGPGAAGAGVAGGGGSAGVGAGAGAAGGAAALGLGLGVLGRPTAVASAGGWGAERGKARWRNRSRAQQAGRGGGAAPSGSALRRLDRSVRKNRPLAEVIAAANAALDTRYERSLAVGFRELCGRLSAAAAAAASAAAVAAAGKNGSGSGGGVAAAGGGGAEGADAGPAGPKEGVEAGGEDVYELLSVLRRLALWPVTVDLLRSTAVGRLAAQLKKHPNPQVSHLARSLVTQWKQAAAAAAAAAPPPALQRTRSAKTPEADPAGGPAPPPSPPAPAIDASLRDKARGLMREALRNHILAVKKAKQLKQQQQPKPQGVSEPDAAETERLETAAADLERALYEAYGSDPSAAASYKAQARALVVALKAPDGVARGLLAGRTDPRVLATADSKALAPASLRAQAEELERRKRQEMEAWEKLAGQGGGASTYKSGATVCPSCGEKGATVHNVLSGGTYAQERVQIQKFVCDHCGNTWRND